MPNPAAGGAGVELADIVRTVAGQYAQAHRLCVPQHRALRAIARCRTPALGTTVAQCDTCGGVTVRYHSCRNRHCPKCQTLAKERWLAARSAELLAVPYFHVVFTLPHALNALAQGNPRIVYKLLFNAAAETLQRFGRDPQWLGGELGVTMVLHTWTQTLTQHLHVHCLVTAGALTHEGQWQPAKPGFLFPVRALSRVFRAKYLSALHQVHAQGQLRLTGAQSVLAEPATFAHLLSQCRSHEWVVYAKAPFAGPGQVLAYLARYTHRIAISNERILGFANDEVRFRFRDRARHDKQRLMALSAEEFLRRFLLHVLPSGFMRIRHYGLFANRHRAEKLCRARRALQQPPPVPIETESVEHFMRRVAGTDIHQCPLCQRGQLHILAIDLSTPRVSHPATGPPS